MVKTVVDYKNKTQELVAQKQPNGNAALENLLERRIIISESSFNEIPCVIRKGWWIGLCGLAT